MEDLDYSDVYYDFDDCDDDGGFILDIDFLFIIFLLGVEVDSYGGLLD